MGVDDTTTGGGYHDDIGPYEDELPKTVGRYVVSGLLGRGGMGAVLDAFDPTLDRRVALKLLKESLGSEHSQRLLLEAQAMAKLSHPNVVQVYEVGEADGQLFIAMELVEGLTLRAWMRADPGPSWRECVEVFIQVGEGLAAAHAQGLVHRDFKPSNAILDERLRARVLDFGLARWVSSDPDKRVRTKPDRRSSISESTVPQDATLTRTGTVLGTPAYMPLEQMRGQEADAYSDQFSFCVSLYEALYGDRPFEGSTMAALMLSMSNDQLRPTPRDRSVPARLRRIVQRGLASAPEQRWPSMDALLVELRRLLAPKARRRIVLGLTGGLVAAGVGLTQYAQVAFRCDGSERELDGIWDDTRRQEVRDALLDTGLSYAPDTWERVDAQLSQYASEWTAKHTEICEATRVTEQQTEEVMDLRMGCLNSRRSDLRATIGVLARADDSHVEKAVELTAGLPTLDRCDDVEALSADLPPPDDPAVAEQVERQRERLAEARALSGAGNFEQSHEVATQAHAEAEAIDHGPLRAEALLLRGFAEDKRGNYEQAEADLEQAFLLAMQYVYPKIEVHAATALAQLVGHTLARPEDGLKWSQMAESLSRRADMPPQILARALRSTSSVLYKHGKLNDAFDKLQRARTLYEQALGPQHLLVAHTLNSIGIVLGDLGKPEQSLEHLYLALEIFEQSLGPTHPNVASALSNVAIQLEQQGKLDEALEFYRRGMKLEIDGLGPKHPAVGRSLANIGSLLYQQGRIDEATETMQRALDLWRESLGPEHPNVSILQSNIAVVLMNQGRLDEALASHQRVLAVQEQTLGPEHLALAMTLNNIASVLHKQGEFEQAQQSTERGLKIRLGELGERHPKVAQTRRMLGILLQDQGQYEEATIHLQHALASEEQINGPEHTNVANVLVLLATNSLELGDRDAAQAMAQRALDIRESSESSDSDLAEARFVYATTTWPVPSERSQAIALARQAANTLKGLEDLDNTRYLAKVERWLEEHASK